MNTFKIGQRVRVMFADCNGHRHASKRHLQGCYNDAVIAQVFAPNALNEPRYLLRNSYCVAAFDACKLVVSSGCYHHS